MREGLGPIWLKFATRPDRDTRTVSRTIFTVPQAEEGTLKWEERYMPPHVIEA